jgi:hypothetical protein
MTLNTPFAIIWPPLAAAITPTIRSYNEKNQYFFAEKLAVQASSTNMYKHTALIIKTDVAIDTVL